MNNSTDPEMTDAENPEWSEALFSRAQQGTTAARKVVGRPKATSPKQSTTLQLDADVIEYFKRGGVVGRLA